jgi:methyl-accepting chemotaxis protein
MRNKIIAVNALIVLIVGLFSWVLVRSALATASDDVATLAGDAKHATFGASAKLQLDALRAELWLSTRAAEPATLDAPNRGTVAAQQEAATARCDAVASGARGSFESAPSLVALVDASGKTLGRNGSTLMRGDDLGAAYAGLKDALATGHSGSDIWVNKDRNDQYLASYAPFRNAQGAVAGALVLGTTLNDELSRVSDATTGRPLVLVEGGEGGARIVAHSTASNPALESIVASSAKDAVHNALESGHVTSALADDLVVATAPLGGLGSGHHAALVGSSPATLIENAKSLANPILGAMALGLVLVIVGGWLLGNYISQPIGMLEEGLLTILNGQSDKRFELDHPELGGLAFRIDQLLNQLMGVEEDTTDAEGRVSQAPSQKNFSDAMSVDDRKSGSAVDAGEGRVDPALVRRLTDEPPADYYARIYLEYIAAKKALGEATEQITETTFVQRIQDMEREASGKLGKAVRYQVASNGREVSLLAVPLA